MITKTSVHALLAMVELAELPPDTYQGASDIARRIGAPANYLGKLLQSLVIEGLVESRKGFGGGFRLAKPATQITLFDVVEPLEQVSRWNGCFLGRGTCSTANPCPVHLRWEVLRNGYLQFLKETTISELVAHPESLPVVT